MFPRSRFLSIATSPARLGLLVFAAAMTFVFVPSAPSVVAAQQTSPAPAPDQQPAAQTSAPAESSQPAPAPPPESQPASPTPTPQKPSADQPQQASPATPAAPEQNPPAPPAESQPAPAPIPTPASAPGSTPASSQPSHAPEPAEITEDEIKTLLVGKELFLRGGYLDNDLSYNENGVLVGHSSQGSYTLSAIQIDKIHLTKHKLELEGQRFGLHFLGALPYEDPTKAVDRVNITPKKKIVKIAIDRELVVKPKEKKEKEKGKEAKAGAKSSLGWYARNGHRASAHRAGPSRRINRRPRNNRSRPDRDCRRSACRRPRRRQKRQPPPHRRPTPTSYCVTPSTTSSLRGLTRA